MNTEGTGSHTYKECHKTEFPWNHTSIAHKERDQLEGRRSDGESSCNSGDGAGQMARPWMFMMMMMMMNLESEGAGRAPTVGYCCIESICEVNCDSRSCSRGPIVTLRSSWLQSSAMIIESLLLHYRLRRFLLRFEQPCHFLLSSRGGHPV